MAPYSFPPRSSPRTWGCFRRRKRTVSARVVFPTHVGVFPGHRIHPCRYRRLPHARGGVSGIARPAASTTRSSPRTWGCFSTPAAWKAQRRVFPTHVGVFPPKAWPASCESRLPHARGGVSARALRCAQQSGSSPRTWGCFSGCGGWRCRQVVFPTHVGVFLTACTSSACASGLPHARGGVSVVSQARAEDVESSPRTWGCFRLARFLLPAPWVFPTHVGVFLFSDHRAASSMRLPHARGGVSHPQGNTEKWYAAPSQSIKMIGKTCPNHPTRNCSDTSERAPSTHRTCS